MPIWYEIIACMLTGYIGWSIPGNTMVRKIVLIAVALIIILFHPTFYRFISGIIDAHI